MASNSSIKAGAAYIELYTKDSRLVKGLNGGQDAATINKAHNLKALRDREHRIARSGYQALVTYNEELTAFKGRLVQSAATLLDREVASGPNGNMVQELLNVVTQCGVAIDQLLQDAKGKIAESINQVTAMGTRLTTTHRQQEMEFQALIEKHQEAQGQAAERAKLERLRNDLLAKQRQKQQNKTVKRELETLRLAGRIEFIGPSKTGTYQLVGT